ESVDRLDEADRADLDQVLVRLAAVAEASGTVLDQRQVQVDERVAGGVALSGGGRLVAEDREELRVAALGLLAGGSCVLPRLVGGHDASEDRTVSRTAYVPGAASIAASAARVASTCQPKLS